MDSERTRARISSMNPGTDPGTIECGEGVAELTCREGDRKEKSGMGSSSGAYTPALARTQLFIEPGEESERASGFQYSGASQQVCFPQSLRVWLVSKMGE